MLLAKCRERKPIVGLVRWRAVRFLLENVMAGAPVGSDIWSNMDSLAVWNFATPLFAVVARNYLKESADGN